MFRNLNFVLIMKINTKGHCNCLVFLLSIIGVFASVKSNEFYLQGKC